jgi:hypothetical protein
MTVTAEHLSSFREDGYCLIRGLIPPEICDAVRLRVLETLEDPPEWATRAWQVIDPERYTTATGHPLPGGIQGPAHNEEVFREMATHPNLEAAMHALLGGDVTLFTDQVGVKQGFITEEQGGCSFFHQDSYYWHIDPALGSNCWIPMQPVGKDAIALAMMPGSQRDWKLKDHEQYFDDPRLGGYGNDTFSPFQRHRIPADEVDFSRETLVPMETGDALFFTNYTWHRSEPNRTGETMMFYGIAYQRQVEAAAGS